ncbi:MAG: aldose 1-epimerase family protein [Solirubrobacteraceae bacterium]
MGGIGRAFTPSGEQFEISHGTQRAVIVEVGGGLREYEVEGAEVLDGYQQRERCRSGRGQILAPWPNRLRDGSYRWGGQTHQLALSEPARRNAIHGLARWSNWRLAERGKAHVVIEHVIHPQDGYPFALALQVEHSLSDSGLTVTTTATNLGEEPAPYGAGAHPYLTVGTETIDECQLQAPGLQRLQTDERAIPTGCVPVAGTEHDFREPRRIGALQLDTGYTELARDADGRARVVLSAPASSRSVAVWLDEHHPYLMLFTGDTLPDEGRRRRGLAVEPMTCSPNAFQSGDGLVTLQPGEPFTSAWGIEP